MAPFTLCRKMSNEDETQFFFVESLVVKEVPEEEEQDEQKADIQMISQIKRDAAIEEQKQIIQMQVEEYK